MLKRSDAYGRAASLLDEADRTNNAALADALTARATAFALLATATKEVEREACSGSSEAPQVPPAPPKPQIGGHL